MPAPTPQDYRGKKVLQQPYDENFKPIPSLFVPLTDPGTGLIVGYLPLKATDNGDGTATLRVDTELDFTGDITISNVKVGSSDGQTSGNKWLKVLSDGTVVIDKTGLATEAKQDTTNTKLDSVIAQLDVTLSSRASEATLLAANVTLGNILAALTGLATETTLAALKSHFDNATGRISAGGVISTVNSSSTPLGASATFTGTAESTLGFSHITVQVFSDQPSATDGLKVEWSTDGTNFDDDDVFNVPANNGKVFTFGPQSQFFRVRYTNGATPQGAFRLQVIKKTFQQKASTHRIQDMLSTDDDAELVKSILTGQKADGTFVNIEASADNRLKVSSLDETAAQADAGNLFAAASGTLNYASAGTEQTFMLIKNPAGSGKTIKIKRFVLSAMTLNKAVAYFLYLNPTVTADGTNLPAYSTTAGSLVTPVGLLSTQPTTTAFGRRIISSSASNGSTVILDEQFAIRIPAGNSLLITLIPQTTNTDTTLAALWAEV